MTKRLLMYMMTIVSLLWGIFISQSSVLADINFNDSRSLTLWSDSLTLYMGQDGSNFYLDALNASGKPLSCEVKMWSTLLQRSNCNDQSFSYYGSDSEMKIYVQLDNDQGTFIYNTSSRTFTSAYRGDTNSSYNYNTNGLISIYPSSSSPGVSQYIALSIRVYDSYGSLDTNFDGEVRFTISKLDNYNSYYTANTNDYYINNNRYTFSSYDNGYVTLSNFLQFYSNGTYKVRVENMNNGAIADTTIYIGTSWCSSCGSNTVSSFAVESNTTSPQLNQYINTNITARDYNNSRVYDYQGTVRFTVERRDNYYSSWSTASSSDYNLSPTSTYLWYSQQGYVSLSNHIRFNRSGLYRLKAVDNNNSGVIWYKEFDVSSSSTNSSYNRFDLTTSTNTPWRDNFVNLVITAKDTNGYTLSSYSNRVRFQVFRRTYTSDSWTDITSSSLDNSNYRIYDTSYNFPSYNNGTTTINNFIKFYSDSYDYKVKVVDDYNNSIYGEIIYYLRNSSSSTNSSYNRFDLTTSTNTPWRDNFVNLVITAKDTNGYTLSSYSNRVRFQVFRRTYTSDSWTDITSSSLDNSNYRIYDTSYNFPSYNNGTTTINNFIKFYSDSYDYKVKVVDDYNNSIYGEIIYYLRNSSSAPYNNNNNSYSSSAYRFVGTLEPLEPDLNTYFDVRLYAKNSSNTTVSNYNRTVRISLERKALAGSTIWSSASTTYCRLSKTTYAFSTNDYGYTTIRDIVKCSKKWFYRLKFTDTNNSAVLGYSYFTIVDTDDFADYVSGFTDSQRESVQETYRTFMSKVNDWEMNNSRLAYNSSRNTLWRSYYSKLNAITYNKSGRLRNYNTFLDEANNFADELNSLIR